MTGAPRAWEPSWALPPGDTLAEAMKEKGLTVKDVARLMRRTPSVVHRILKGYTVISPENALRLEEAMGISARMWMALDSTYRLHQARLRRERGEPADDN